MKNLFLTPVEKRGVGEFRTAQKEKKLHSNNLFSINSFTRLTSESFPTEAKAWLVVLFDPTLQEIQTSYHRWQ